MKTLLGLLSLVIVLVYGQDQAKQDTQTCGKTLGPEELHQVGGSWVLLALTFEKGRGQRRSIPQSSSSHLEIQVQSENQTFTVHENNMVMGRCVSMDYNVTLKRSENAVRLHMHKTAMIVNGERIPVNDRANLQLFHSSQNTWILLFKTDDGEVMLGLYRRDGHHHEDLQKDLEIYRAMAQCLGLSRGGHEEWHYNGTAGFCNKKSALGPEDLQQMAGDWVVTALTFDKVKSRGRQIPLMTSSQLEVRVRSDNRSVSVQEHNAVGGHCASYPFTVSLPASGRRMELHRTVWFLNGERRPLEERATVEIFHSSANTFSLHYTGDNHEQFLILYRRSGHRLENLQKNLEEHRAKAQQLGLSGGDYEVWIYDGTAAFCRTPDLLRTGLSAGPDSSDP